MLKTNVPIVYTHMSHITLSCNLSVKIDFSLDSDSKYHDNQEKIAFFYRSIKGLKWRVFEVKMTLTVYGLAFSYLASELLPYYDKSY